MCFWGLEAICDNMKKKDFVCVLLACVVFMTSCASTTRIETYPSGAKLYVDGEFVGETPCDYTDSKIIGSSIGVRLEKEGYKPITTIITKDEEPNIGAAVAGYFFLVPLLWAMKYRPFHNYELVSIKNDEGMSAMPIKEGNEVSITIKLQELKTAFEQGLITKEEYDAKRTKILEEL